MQNAKDSFYIALRTGLAAEFPQRVCRLRGVERPAVIVEEAEAPMAELMEDVFVLRWGKAERVSDVPGPLYGLVCEVLYATSGSGTYAGLDRGRALSAMDDVLVQLLEPGATAKLSYAGTPPSVTGTNIFWAAPVLGATTVVRNQLQRAAMVTVFSFEGEGEI